MALNSCCSWRSFQVRGANQCAGTSGPKGSRELGEYGSRVLEETW